MIDNPRSKRLDVAGIVIAGLLLLLSAIVWWDMNSLSLSATYGMGPKAMPGVISIITSTAAMKIRHTQLPSG